MLGTKGEGTPLRTPNGVVILPTNSKLGWAGISVLKETASKCGTERGAGWRLGAPLLALPFLRAKLPADGGPGAW